MPGGFCVSGDVFLAEQCTHIRTKGAGHMSEQDARMQELAKKKVVYRIPGMDAAVVLRDVTYRSTDDGALVMDLYFPAERKIGERLPVVVIVLGYPDPNGHHRLGLVRFHAHSRPPRP